MDNANEELSKCLQDILDVIGASEYVRKKYWELAMLNEITLTFACQCYYQCPYKRTFYQVGSTCEVTTTPGLNSDCDIIQCYEDIPVVDNLVDSKHPGKYYLILTDDTKPGYVRLQRVKDKCPLYIPMYDVPEYSALKIDHKGRICLTHQTMIGELSTTRNGPADTVSIGMLRQNDLVYALRCRQIPRSAGNAWLYRTRKYDWPSKKQLKAMGSYGCFLVGVGHPHSDNTSFEWRISFSNQERYLMASLNETQHKCYILLKMIKKDIIEPNTGESISSYHCKTSLFYTMENSQRTIWRDCNLILCVQLCLMRLLKWVKIKKCPNYFIPEVNMFAKLHRKTLKKLENVLNDIIESDTRFIYKLTCDAVGERLKYKMCRSEMVFSLGNTSSMLQALLVCFSITRKVYEERNDFLRYMHMSSNTHTDYLNETKRLLPYLQNTNHVKEQTTRDVRMAFDSVIPHIQLQFQQCIFANYLSRGDGNCKCSKTIPNVISETSDCDLISSELSLASLYIQFTQLEEECKCILEACENSLEPYMISVCGCDDRNGGLFQLNQALAEKLQFTDMSSKDFRRHCTTGCMVFHPSQVGLVHAALQYEVFRNVYTTRDPVIESIRHYWLNWITVDSKTYLYFLQYLLLSKNKKNTYKVTAVQKLIHALKTDYNLGHKETALNLLGWIVFQENEVPKAWLTFCLSWKIRPFKNAAKWHMLILLREVIKENRGFMM